MTLVVAALACSSSSNASAEATGCDDLYTKYFARCALAGYPASEISRLQGRWDTYCDSFTSLPGFTATGAEIEQCAAAYGTLDCDSEVTPPACSALNTGTLAAGAACLQGSQCESGSCDTNLPDGGGTTASGCGTCDTLVPLGGSCLATNSACAPNATCNQVQNGSAPPTATCIASSTADAGPAPTTIAAGGACNLSGSDSYCGPGLGCGPQNTCVALTYVTAGQPCDYETKFCLVGSCNGATTTESPDGGISSTPGTCPTVLTEGQSCTANSSATTCDTFASCVNGTCVLAETASLCK
jgi:hypothetical protein